MADPLDIGDVKIELDFKSDSTGRIQITDPGGFQSSNLTLKQEDKRLGRDVLYGSGEIELVFYPDVEVDGHTHEFDRIIQYWKTYGFESDIGYIISINDVDTFVGELDFENAETDLINYFKCKVIQDALQVKIKRRSDVNVDLFSDTDVDGNPITPLTSVGVLLKANPEKQISKWSLPNSFSNDGSTITGNSFINFSLTPQIDESGIDFTGFPTFFVSTLTSRLDETLFLEAENSLTNVTLKLSDFTYDISGRLATSGDPRDVTTTINYKVGVDFATGTTQTVTIPNSGTNYSYETTVFSIPRDQKLWFWINTDADGGENLLYDIDFTSLDIEVESVSKSIDSVTQAVTLYEAMEQVVSSVAGVSISAPRFAPGGEFEKQYIFTGTLIRGITDRAYNITFEDILDQLKEFRCGYQILPDNTIFFGRFEDFYTNNQMGSYPTQPNLEFSKGVNTRYTNNKITFKYDKYEKGRNEGVENSLEGIHTECQMLLPNEKVEAIKEIEVPFIRDAFLIEKVRREGVEVQNREAKENDDDNFIIDVYEETGTIARSEGMLVNQSVVNVTTLELSNDGSFSFDLIGLTVGQSVSITGSNVGTYSVTGLTSGTVSLVAVSPTPNPTVDGQEFIIFDYNVTSTDLITRTDQGFSVVDGSSDPEGFANMIYSPKRNIKNFYDQFLATACFYRQTSTVINTKFLHNGEFTTRLDSEVVNTVENEDIDVSDLPTAILKPTTTRTQVFMDWDIAWQLMLDVRNIRGYVTIIDSEENTVNVHPTSLEFDWSRNVLTIEGEDRN